jgi:DNA-binding MarR family transcriptional regulator
MSFDALVSNAGRLRILTALAVENRQEFVQLRRLTQLTDGNLSAHARRLETAGLVAIQKTFREGKPVTTFHLTDDGRRRLHEHVNALLLAVGEQPMLVGAGAPTAEADAPAEDLREDWVD